MLVPEPEDKLLMKEKDAGDCSQKAFLKNQWVKCGQPTGCILVPQKETHHGRLHGARETALVSSPHLVSELWVAEVSTEGHWCGHVYHIDRRPMA